MPEPIVNDPDVKVDPPADDPGVNADPVNKDDKNDPRNNPLYGRVQELSAKNKKLAEDMAKIESDRAKVRNTQLEKQGEYKTLLDEANAKLTAAETERDTAVNKWGTYETARRETLTADLSDDDKALVAKLDFMDVEPFITRITGEIITTGTDTRRSTGRVDEKPLKSFADMSAKELRDTHKQRLAQYDKT